MDDILTYLKAMLEWWWLYLTGGPFLLDEVVKKLLPRWRGLDAVVRPEIRRKIEVGVLICGVFLAGFFVWREQKAANEESLWVTFRVFDLDELGHPKVEMSYYFENLGQSAIIIEDVSLIIAVAKDKSADWEKNFLLCRPPNIPHPQFMSMYPDNVKYTATNAGR